MMLVAFVVFAILYLLYVALSAAWCIYFHPLSHIPGPKSWIAFPILRYAEGARGKLDSNLQAFHAKYGEAVRFAPNEVSFITAQAWKDIYGHGHRQLPKATNSSTDPSGIISANDVDHSRYRKALSHAFSAKAMQAQEPIIIGYVDKLIEKLRGVAESRMPVDMVKWYNLTTFDLIGDLAFGKPFGGLENSEYHHWVATIFNFVKVFPLVRFGDRYPLLFKLVLLLLPQSLKEGQKRQREHSRITVQERLDNQAAHGRNDFMDSMLRHRGEKDGLTEDELVANSNILIIAGSETTATLLSGVTYWLLRTPEALHKVTSEVRSTMEAEADITFNNVTATLPYMLACINESFRMYPPVPTGLQRVTFPSNPMQISGYEVPPETKVSVHQSAAYWSPANFHDPNRFIPERWLPEVYEDPTSLFHADKRDVCQPFSVGPRNCIGKNLAYNEMRVILARVLWNFDLELCQESLGWSNQNAYTLWEKPALMCRLKTRSDRLGRQ